MKGKGLRALGALCALVAVLLAWAAPTPAWAATLAVGEGQTYETFDEAVEKANNGDVIELHGDVTTAGMNLSKSLTVTAAADAAERPTLTFTDEGIALWGKSLTFQNIDVMMDGIGATPYAEWKWMAFCISGEATFTLDNAMLTMDAEGTTNSPHAIYVTSPTAVINVRNDSTLSISNYANDAVEWDGGGSGYSFNVTDSTFIADGCRSGLAGTFTMTITNSEVDVVNSAGNGSNGSHFIIDNSDVDFSNNGSHGLSTGELTVTKGSKITANGNGLTGVHVGGGDFYLDGTSSITSNNNGATSWGAGLNLTASGTGEVESGATLTLVGNGGDGLDNQRTTVMHDGAKVTITNNSDGNGGGIYNPGNLTLPSDAQVYNNHATTSGDDIYSTGSITFGHVGSGWKLDGVGCGGNPDDCTDAIDGWYVDAADARWEAHADTYDGVHVEEYAFDDDTTTVTGTLALKAAHGLGVVTVDPADITIYMGGTDGYEGVSSNGQITGSNSLPEPGFYLALPDDVNAALQAAGATTEGETADLSQYLTIYTHGYDGENGELHWTLEPYSETYSGANGRHIYRIVPASAEGQEAVPVRLEFTDAEGNTSTSDAFEPSESGALNEHYTMQLYTELVNKNQVVFEVDVNGQKFYNTMELETGDLNVRYVTGDQADVVTDILTTVEDLAAAKEENADKAYAVVPEGARFTINESQVDVTDSAAPSLLFDNVVSDHNTEGAGDYDQQLANRAVDVAAEAGTAYTHPWYEAKYLDLVDASNGNAWLTSSEPVTVYWPYPVGTDENTEFTLVHFEGLDREMGNGEVENNIASANAVSVEIENTPYGIKFTTTGFSPFVLMWEGEGEQPAPEDTKKPSTGNLAQTGDNSMALIAGVGAAGVACLGAALAVKKHSKGEE